MVPSKLHVYGNKLYESFWSKSAQSNLLHHQLIRLVSFASKQLKTVAFSSCEAEYAAASYACKEIEFVRNICADMGVILQGRLVLALDNTAAITIAHDVGVSGCTRTCIPVLTGCNRRACRHASPGGCTRISLSALISPRKPPRRQQPGRSSRARLNTYCKKTTCATSGPSRRARAPTQPQPKVLTGCNHRACRHASPGGCTSRPLHPR